MHLIRRDRIRIATLSGNWPMVLGIPCRVGPEISALAGVRCEDYASAIRSVSAFAVGIGTAHVNDIRGARRRINHVVVPALTATVTSSRRNHFKRGQVGESRH